MELISVIFLFIGSSFLGSYAGYRLGYEKGNKIGLANGEKICYSKIKKKEDSEVSLMIEKKLSLRKKKNNHDTVWMG